MNKIINTIYVSLFSIIILSITVYLFSITYSNVRYYKHYVDGVIIDKKTEYSSSSQTRGYSEFQYKVLTKNKDTLLSSNHLKYDFSINAQIKGRLVSERSIKILAVNGEKIQSDYDFLDLLSLVLCFVILIIVIRIIFKKIKK